MKRLLLVLLCFALALPAGCDTFREERREQELESKIEEMTELSGKDEDRFNELYRYAEELEEELTELKAEHEKKLAEHQRQVKELEDRIAELEEQIEEE